MTASLPRWSIVPLALALLCGLWLAADGRLSGDEPGYLYAAAYQTVPQLLAGEVQATGIPGFVQGRVLHVLFIKGVMSLTGAGPEGFRVLQVIHLAIVALNLLLIGRITRELLPQVAEAAIAPLVLALAPIVLYFALKTTADNEGLLGALAATWGLARVARGPGVAGPLALVLGLVAAALTKNQMIFVPIAFWLAGCLVPVAAIDRRRLLLAGGALGLAAGVATIALIESLGIGLSSYLQSYASPFANRTPLVAKLMNLGTELGLAWLLLPIALATRRRRELKFFGLWFAAAMLPFLFMSGVEPRHVAVNLAPASGLIALALEALRRRPLAWERFGDLGRAALASAGVVLVMAFNALALAIMPHKVDLGALQDALSALDARYGAGGYTLVASNPYSDFHVLRVLWPERAVLTAGAAEYAIDDSRRPRSVLMREYLGDRAVGDLAGLGRFPDPKVFFGFRRTFAAANLDAILTAVSPALAARVLGRVHIEEHLYSPYTAWLWDSPALRLEPVLTGGNYQALEIRPRGE